MRQTIAQAATDAALGRNESLWQACWEIAQERKWSIDPHIQNQEMCERAIKEMSPAQRALYFEEAK